MNKVNYFKIDKNFNIEKTNPEKKKKKTESKLINYNQVVELLNIGYNLFAPLVLGAILGFLADKSYQTKPRFTLLFIFFGILASFYNLWQLINASH